MHDPIHLQAIELLLSSISKRADDGLRSSFLFGKPGAPSWDRRFGTEVFYCPKKLNRAALLVRQRGPSYLRDLPLRDICGMLQGFVADCYWHISEDTFLTTFETSFAEQVSISAQAKLADALAAS